MPDEQKSKPVPSDRVKFRRFRNGIGHDMPTGTGKPPAQSLPVELGADEDIVKTRNQQRLQYPPYYRLEPAHRRQSRSDQGPKRLYRSEFGLRFVTVEIEDRSVKDDAVPL